MMWGDVMGGWSMCSASMAVSDNYAQVLASLVLISIQIMGLGGTMYIETLFISRR